MHNGHSSCSSLPFIVLIDNDASSAPLPVGNAADFAWVHRVEDRWEENRHLQKSLTLQDLFSRERWRLIVGRGKKMASEFLQKKKIGEILIELGFLSKEKLEIPGFQFSLYCKEF